MAEPFQFDAFVAHARAIAERFEARRGEFLHKLKFRALIALILLGSFPWWYGLMTRWDHAGVGALSSLVWLLIHISAAILIVAGIVAFGIMPLFRYRHYTAQIVSGVAQQNISLKGEIFSRLFSYFGNFTMYGDRKVALKSFRNAPDMPEFDEYESEDYIKGVMSGISVEITEVQIRLYRHTGQVPLFNGLMIVLDINDPNLVLHGKFSGKTVLIAHRERGDDYVMMKYEGYKRVALPDPSFGEHYEAFTTDSVEAERLLTDDLLRQILKLSDAVRNVRNQRLSADDRIAYAIAGFARAGGNGLAGIAEGLVNWFNTGSFRVRATRPEMQLAESAVPADAKGLNSAVHCAFFDDKVLITIPYQHNLFEPDSIFRPPLNEEDIKLAYDLMSTVDGISKAVLDALPKSAF